MPDLLLRSIFTNFTHRYAIREDRRHLGKSKMCVFSLENVYRVTAFAIALILRENNLQNKFCAYFRFVWRQEPRCFLAA